MVCSYVDLNLCRYSAVLPDTAMAALKTIKKTKKPVAKKSMKKNKRPSGKKKSKKARGVEYGVKTWSDRGDDGWVLADLVWKKDKHVVQEHWVKLP